MVPDLSVEFCGVKFKNPFILSSSPASRVEVLPRAARAGWAGAVTWGGELASEPAPGSRVDIHQFSVPHGVKYIGKPPCFWSFQETGHTFRPEGEDPGRIVKRIEVLVKKAKESGLPIIMDTGGGGEDVDIVVRNCVAAERAGADILEVNVSYAVTPGCGMHLGYHRDLEKTKALIGAVRKETSIPLMVKLSAFVIAQELKDWAGACVEAGADAIALTNSIPGFAGIDVETGRPYSAVKDVNGKMRGIVEIVTGPGIKPIGMAGVAWVDAAVDVPISAIGGVADWHDAVEYMMLGASTVQVASAAIAYGHGFVKSLIRGLEEFMIRKGYKTIDDFVGFTNQKYLVGYPYSTPAPSTRQPRRIIIDTEKCTGCRLCVPPCETAAYSAIQVIDGVAVIDEGLCEKCNLCILVCPEGAVKTEWESECLV